MTIVGRDPLSERWEPPRPEPEAGESGTRPPRPRRDVRDVWATAALAAVGRAGVAVLLVATGLSVVPAAVSAALGVVMVLTLFMVTAAAWHAGLPGWGTIWLTDLIAVGLVIPLAVMNGFTASGTSSVPAAGQSAFAETWFALAASLVLAAIVAWVQERRAPGYAGLALLPAALAVPAVLSSLADYRDAPILRALAFAVGLAGLATLLAWSAGAGSRRLVAPTIWLLYALVVLIPARGATNLGAHGPGVGLGYLLLLLASAAMVLLGPSAFGRRRDRGASRRRMRSGGRHAVQETTDDLPDLYSD